MDKKEVELTENSLTNFVSNLPTESKVTWDWVYEYNNLIGTFESMLNLSLAGYKVPESDLTHIIQKDAKGEIRLLQTLCDRALIIYKAQELNFYLLQLYEAERPIFGFHAPALIDERKE